MQKDRPRLVFPGRRAKVGLCLALAASGCKQSGDDGEPAKAKPAAPAEAAPAVPGKQAEPAVAAPRTMPTAATSDDAFGTLPEGIGVPPGTPLPDVQASAVDGSDVSLQKLVAGKRAMIVFYRGGWCPFCNFQIKSLVDDYAEFKKRNIAIVAISVDRPRETAKTQAAHEPPFTLLSDQTLRTHNAFKVLHGVDEDTLRKLKAKGMDLEASSGRRHHMIAVPAVFLVDEKGVVRFSHADRDYKTRPATRQLLAKADELFGAP